MHDHPIQGMGFPNHPILDMAHDITNDIPFPRVLDITALLYTRMTRLDTVPDKNMLPLRLLFELHHAPEWSVALLQSHHLHLTGDTTRATRLQGIPTGTIHLEKIRLDIPPATTTQLKVRAETKLLHQRQFPLEF